MAIALSSCVPSRPAACGNGVSIYRLAASNQPESSAIGHYDLFGQGGAVSVELPAVGVVHREDVVEGSLQQARLEETLQQSLPQRPVDMYHVLLVVRPEAAVRLEPVTATDAGILVAVCGRHVLGVFYFMRVPSSDLGMVTIDTSDRTVAEELIAAMGAK